MLQLIILVILLLAICSGSTVTRRETVRLNIPWPSGIQIDKITGSDGNTFRFGRLQRNAISLRPGSERIFLINGVLSLEECAELVAKAERYAGRYGWSKGRHVDYSIRPTRDLPVEIIFESEDELESLYQSFSGNLWPRMAELFHLDKTKIRLTDLFITKYNSSNSVERQLAPHKDKSPWSFVIALNDGFTGGGTYFQNDDSLHKGSVGDALAFNGNQLHGAQAITEGVRYIMAGFCEYGEEYPVDSEEAHAAFLSQYDPVFDGFAAQAGFRSGDLVVGMEVCSRSGDDDVIIRHRVSITGRTTDAEWSKWAQTCELLEPGSDTVLWVQRRV